METSFYSEKEIAGLGLKSVGRDVMISRKASIYSPDKISIGDNSRIDDFCVLSGNIEIGRYVHIAAHVCLFANSGKIIFGDFSGASSKVSVYAVRDDFSGEHMANPALPKKYKNLIVTTIVIGKHALIGSGSTLLPGAGIGEGTTLGAMSLAVKELDEWSHYQGNPCRKIGERKKDLLEEEKQFWIELEEAKNAQNT